jgi:hypothetical protein
MTTKIDRKITGYAVVQPTAEATPAPVPVETGPLIDQMGEHIERPEAMSGMTYKIKPPQVDHAMYITINDVLLNPGTPHEHLHPFEIFINSKNMDQFQWVVALTRIMSAVFRKGGDVTFVVEEMKAVFDPRGGYFRPGGVYMPSLIAEIGDVVERHLKSIGLIKAPELSASQRQLIADKRAAIEGKAAAPSAEDNGSFPASASVCPKCSVKALVLMDGCQTCLNCAYSKCG